MVRRRQLLIALNDAAVEGGYLDPRGIEEFLLAGFEIRSLRNLHAKVVIADECWALVGSGNLTVAGSSGGNAELGVVLDAKQARRAQRTFFKAWWAAAEPLDVDYLRSLERTVRPPSPTRRQRKGKGGLFSTESGQLLRSVQSPSHNPYWLKIMHHRPEREDPSSWHGEFWISDAHRLRPSDGAPLLRPSYQVGDRLVIYLSRDERHACPAIVRVTRPPIYEPDRVRRDGGRPGDDDQWAWVTEVVGERATALEDAPTLSELGVASASVRQHSHIALTPDQFRRAVQAMPI
jgi:hypothetical protein